MGAGEGGGGGFSQGIGTRPTNSAFTLGSSKIEVSETYYFDIVTTQNDHSRYVKRATRTHVFAIGCAGGGGGQTGLVHNRLMQFFSRYSSKK